jgi:hypothetical protein
MEKEYDIAELFKELNFENQETLLACARVSRTAENAVKKRLGRNQQGAGPERIATRQDTQEGVSLH